MPLLVALARTAPDVLMYMHAYIHTYICSEGPEVLVYMKAIGTRPVYITQVRTAPDVLMVLAQRGRAKAAYYI